MLIRHAKAARDSAVDLERSLANRGRSEALLIGRWLVEHELRPDGVVVSPARRARQTWNLAAIAIGDAPEPERDDRIYTNTVDDLLAVIHDAADGVGTLMVVGHNPSIEQLAVALDDGRGDAAARDALMEKYPTSGVAVFAIDVDWSRVDRGSGTLMSFVVPRG